MKNLVFLILTSVFLISIVKPDKNQITLKGYAKQYVYICDSKGAKKYHLDKDCKGLNACTHKIIKVTKTEAAEKGKPDLCKFEY